VEREGGVGGRRFSGVLGGVELSERKRESPGLPA
jgi:hypothetical protein